MSETKYTDANCLARYNHARKADLPCERVGRGVYHVGSETGEHFYTVTLETDRGTCNCLAGFAGKMCKHLALAAATEFPSLLTTWLRAEWRKVWHRSILALLWPYDESPAEMMADIRRLDAEAAEILGVERMKAA